MQNFNVIRDSEMPENNHNKLNTFLFSVLDFATRSTGLQLIFRLWIRRRLRPNCLLTKRALTISSDTSWTGLCKSSMVKIILEEHGYAIHTRDTQTISNSDPTINSYLISANTIEELLQKSTELAISVAEHQHKC